MQSAFLGIFATGLLAGASYLPITLQMLLGTGYLQQTTQTITFYFFPLCWAVLGLGFVIEARHGRAQFPLMASVLLLLFLACSLILPLNVDSQGLLAVRILVCWIPAALLYFLLGQELNSYLTEAGARVHYLYGLFLVAMAVGGVFSDQFVKVIGGNALLILLAVMILSTRFSWKRGVGLVLATGLVLHFAKLDLRIERLRHVAHNTNLDDLTQDLGESKKKSALSHLSHYSRAFDQIAWNRRGMTFLHKDNDAQAYMGILNLQAEHQFPFVRDPLRRQAHHSLFTKDHDIIFVGVGSGRTVWSLPSELATKKVFAIERDGNTVRLMRSNGINPQLPFVNFLDHDGRAFIEQSKKQWDWIVLESSVDQRNTSPFQLFQPHNLYTPEAIRTYWDRLKEGGTLVIEINRPEDKGRRWIPTAIAGSLDSIVDPRAQTLYVMKNPNPAKGAPGPLLMHLRKGGDPLSLAGLKIDASARIEQSSDLFSRPCSDRYSDAMPFLDWMCMLPPNRTHIFFYTCWMLGILLVGFFVNEFLLSQKSLGITQMKSVFVLQSIAHCFLFLGVSYLLRSAFQDEIGTFYVFTYATTLMASLASFYVDRRLSRGQLVRFAPTAVAMIFSLAWLFLILNLGIDSIPQLFVRFFVLVLAVFPFYFFSSLMFHVNLQRAVNFQNGLRQAFLYDSLALVPAYLLVPWILFERGIPTLIFSAAGIYLVMLVLAWRQRGIPASTHSPST